MKRLWILTITLLAGTFAQAPADKPKPAGDPVVVVMEGKEWKKSELEMLVRSLPPAVFKNYYTNKRAFLQQFALMTRLAHMAEEEKMDQQEPHKSRLYYNRLLYLAQARTEAQTPRLIISTEDQEKYYSEHKDEFSRARIKVIYLSFNDNPGPARDPKAQRPRTSEEAEKLAQDIVARLRSGADFVEMVKKYSDDADSKAKDGDFTPIKPADTSLPAAIRTAVFALKPGQVSDPVRQSGGFWIFKMIEFVVPPFHEVSLDVFNVLQEARFRQWMDSVQSKVDLVFRDEKYLDEQSPAQ